MPMIDAHAAAGTFPGKHQLAVDLATAVLRIEQVPDIAMSGALDRGKQLAITRQLTGIIAAAAGHPAPAGRTWGLLTGAPDGGRGLSGHANTNAALISAARAQTAERSTNPPGS